jgi:hypothetical protein
MAAKRLRLSLSDQRKRSKETREPFFPFSPVPHQAEGDRHKRGEAASAQSKPAISAPHRILGAEMSRNKQRRERSDPPSGDGSASGVPAWMLALRLPVAVFGISGREGAEGRRVATGAKRSLGARDGEAGMPEREFRIAAKSPEMPWEASNGLGRGGKPGQRPNTAVRTVGRAGG